MTDLSKNFQTLGPVQRLLFSGLSLISIIVLIALFFWAVWPDLSLFSVGGGGVEISGEDRLLEAAFRYIFVLLITFSIIFLVLGPMIKGLFNYDARSERPEASTMPEGQGVLREVSDGPSIENARKGLMDKVTKNPRGAANIIKIWLRAKGSLDNSRLNGTNKAALVVSNLGEALATDILKFLSPGDLLSVGHAIKTIENTSSESFFMVTDEFTERLALDIGPDDTEEYVRNIMINALGQDLGNAALKRMSNQSEEGAFEILKWIEPDVVAEFIKHEHPQTIAVILASLIPEQAAKVLSQLDDSSRADVLIRVATMEPLAPAVMEELSEAVNRNFSTMVGLEQNRSLGGVRAVAEILTRTDKKVESDILYDIESRDSLLSVEIEEKMFVFDDIINIDDRGIQKILKDISRDQLVLSLRTADGELKEKFFANMSERVRDMFHDEMDIRGSLKLSEVEQAQLEVVRVVRRLVEGGEVAIMDRKGKGVEDILV